MITIFTIPKPFSGHIDVIQRNAIKSWTLLKPKCEIILLGSEPGIKEICAEFGLKHIENVKKNEFGTPLLNSAFELAKENSDNEFLCYVNCDIILIDDFIKAILQVEKKFNSFLIFSQRWDTEIKNPLDFSKENWQEDLRGLANKNGSKPLGMDCFIFPRDFRHNMPSFAVGRPGWDNWFLYNANLLKVPTIDITMDAFVIHQNHGYNKDFSHFAESENGKAEIKSNLKLMGGIFKNFTPRDAGWLLLNGQFVKNKKSLFLNRCYSYLGALPKFYSYFNIGKKILFLPVFLLSVVAIKIKHY